MDEEKHEAQAKEWRRKIDFHEDRARRFHCGEQLTRLEVWVRDSNVEWTDEAHDGLREWILEERKALLVRP